VEDLSEARHHRKNGSNTLRVLVLNAISEILQCLDVSVDYKRLLVGAVVIRLWELWREKDVVAKVCALAQRDSMVGGSIVTRAR
jgi:hypothetical protein